MSTVIVIPVRYGSTRFPGKPLVQIKGLSMIRRVWQICCAVEGVDEICVATDDSRIQDHAASFGAQVLMTREGCRNGTERVFEAVQQLSRRPEIVINVQGDAVLTPPWVVQALVRHMQKKPACSMGTLAVALSQEQYCQLRDNATAEGRGGVFVTFDLFGRALYFSRAMIPHVRNRETENPPLHKHIGVYAYRFDTLAKYLTLEPSVLEETEKLEQLRALENGIPIEVVRVDCRGRTLWSVDHPEDAKKVEQIIEREGELLARS